MSSPTRYATIAELNDMAEAIMEELHQFKAVMEARMDNLEGRFDRFETRLNDVETRLANVEGALFVIGQVLRKVYPDEFGEVEGSGA